MPSESAKMEQSRQLQKFESRINHEYYRKTKKVMFPGFVFCIIMKDVESTHFQEKE